MKTFFAAILFVSQLTFAQDPQTQPAQVPNTTPKITTKDAKKSCRGEGKTGAELIKCMKEKKEEK